MIVYFKQHTNIFVKKTLVPFYEVSCLDRSTLFITKEYHYRGVSLMKMLKFIKGVLCKNFLVSEKKITRLI